MAFSIQEILSFCLMLTGLPFFVREVFASNRVTIINYHDPDPDVFERHMRAFVRVYTFISIDQLAQALRCIATHLIKKAGFSRKPARAGAVTLIQRFGSALNLNVHFHMLFLDGVYVERPDGALRFCWVRAPTSAELAGLTQTLARRIGRFLERQGLLERDAENSYLAGDVLEAGLMDQLLGSSITYRIAVGPQQGRKVFTLQTLPGCEEPFDAGVDKVAGFSLHAGVAARAYEHDLARVLHPSGSPLTPTPANDSLLNEAKL